MKLHQLSVFLENKPGQLRALCQTLAEADLNIVTMTLADTKAFGIARLIFEDWERAKSVLAEAGFAANVAEVLALEVADRPGGLAEVLTAIDESGLNVEYMYALTFGRGDKAVLIFRFDNVEAALTQLQDKGVSILGNGELYAHLEN